MRNKIYTEEQFSEAIRRADEFKGGFDKFTSPIIITDEDGVILFANDAIAQRTGYQSKELIGKTPGELWGNQRDESFYEYMWETIKVDKKQFTANNMTNRRKDGSYYSCDFNIYPILDDNRNISFFVGVETDFSDSI